MATFKYKFLIKTHLNCISIVKLNIESLFLFLFPSRNVFYDKCGDNDASVATFVANSFLMLDTAALDD